MAPSGFSDDKDAHIQEKILTGLGELHALGIAEVPRIYVALFAGYGSLTTASFSRNLSALINSELIRKTSPGKVSISATGKASLFLAASPMSNDETLDRLQKVLETVAAGTKAREICYILSDGQAHSYEDILRDLGLTSLTTSSFTKAKSILRKLQLVTVTKEGMCLGDIAFPEGRPSASV